jgi:molybdenum cofactor cytidylyltransferase
MISTIIVAAGESRRMGEPKMLLPWEKTTVLEHVISIFAKAGLENILVVTGAIQEQMEEIIREYGKRYPVRWVTNRNYKKGEMLSSLQCGLQALALTPTSDAALIGLGDQPQIQERTVRLICDAFKNTESPIVAPSYQMRRGHPWLVARLLWDDLLNMKSPQSPRDFLSTHANSIHYVDVETPSILADLDTPEDYRNSFP